MKFSEIESREEISQMSIGQQLEILSKMKEIEYQNSLVMMSLEQYNSKYEQLKIEQKELLEKVNEKVIKLQQSNEILNQNLKNILESLDKEVSKKISTLSDETKKIIEDMGNDIDSLLNSKLTDLSTESIKYMEKVEELKNEAQNRSRSFWGRKKIIDILIMINLAITPIALILISYWIFFKK